MDVKNENKMIFFCLTEKSAQSSSLLEFYFNKSAPMRTKCDHCDCFYLF